MRKLLMIVLSAGLGLGLLAGCAKSPTAPAMAKEQRVKVVRSLPAQSLAARGGNMLLGSGKVEGAEYVLLTSVRLFPQDGMLAICAAARLLSGSDVTQQIAAKMKDPGNNLTLKRLSDGNVVTLSPGFIPIVFSQTAPDKEGRIAFVPSDLGEVTGSCVVTDASWQEQWRGKYGGKLALPGMY